jgi:hypothetical protein
MKRESNVLGLLVAGIPPRTREGQPAPRGKTATGRASGHPRTTSIARDVPGTQGHGSFIDAPTLGRAAYLAVNGGSPVINQHDMSGAGPCGKLQ